MPTTKCLCGTILNDDDPVTTEVHLIFNEDDWEKRESESDWKKKIPFTYEAWRCKKCGKWYLYRLHEESPFEILTPIE